MRRGNYHQRNNSKTSPKASIKAQVYRSPKRKRRHRPRLATLIRNDGLATTGEQYASQPPSAAARLRAARGPFNRYSKTLKDRIAEEAQVDRIGEARPETHSATAAPGTSSILTDSPSNSTANKI